MPEKKVGGGEKTGLDGTLQCLLTGISATVNLADLDNLLYVQISGVDAFRESDIGFTILH